MVLDGTLIVERGLLEANGDPRSYLLACYPEAEIPPLDHVSPTSEPLTARVNHGVWIASCSCDMPGLPRPGCVVFLDVLLGWCVRCSNRAWGGGWRPIVAPPVEERARIAAVLSCRPDVGDRNWEPEETVADLVAQNREHGDPVPDLDEPSGGAVPADPSPTKFPPAEVMRAVLGPRARRRGLLHRLLRR